MKKFRPDLKVDSAGIHNAIPISEIAREFLARENAGQYLKKAPEDLDSKQLNEYDLIVAMEPRHRDIILSICPECKGKIVVWDIEDPYFLDEGYAEKVFNQIRQKVKELADSL